MRNLNRISGMITDVIQRKIFPGTLEIENGIITRIIEEESAPEIFILPGFTDAHIHIESSMLTPYEFARAALKHGTVSTVSDPHEIANVMGIEGVEYMLEDAKDAMLKFHFGAPSCVPATTFESSGDTLDPNSTDSLLQRKDIYYLSEMMNYPGVIHDDPEVHLKIKSAHKYGKPVDGHAPGLRGEGLKKYISAGISTDHECFTLEEALEKISLGMKILIREGSAARNFDALHPLLKSHPAMCMFCSDDKHPDELLNGHINKLVATALSKGYDLFDVLHAACVHPVKHYNLKSGLLQTGDPADFIITNDLTEFNILTTVINGKVVYENGECFLPEKPIQLINRFNASEITLTDIRYQPRNRNLRVIEAFDGQLVTGEIGSAEKIENDNVVSDIENDILKIIVLNRYRKSKPSIAFIKNFGLKSGAIASTVAHDSHNIICVGADDASIIKAVNLLIENKGGLSVCSPGEDLVLPLPVAGLISSLSAEITGKKYSRLDQAAKELGSKLRAPFMTLSFMALLVIPKLKLSDKGLFDCELFSLIDEKA